MIVQSLNRRNITSLFRTFGRCSQPGEAKPANRNFLVRVGSALLRDEEGGPLVEMAFALPLMMLLITGMFSLGLMMSSYLMVSHAVDVGARNLALSRGATTNPCSDTVSIIQSAAPTAASTLTYTFKIGPDTFSGTSSSFSGSGSGDCSQLGVSDMVAGDTATVSVTYPYQLLVYLWSAKTYNITASTSEVIQ
jgi:Flp pilus assembly protein TadG